MKYFNRVRVLSPTEGTGDTIAIGLPFSNGFNTFAEAGAEEGDETTIVVEQGSDYAIYRATVGADAESVTIDEVLMSKIAGVVGTSRLDLDGSADIRCSESADDLNGALRFDIPQLLTLEQ